MSTHLRQRYTACFVLFVAVFLAWLASNSQKPCEGKKGEAYSQCIRLNYP